VHLSVGVGNNNKGTKQILHPDLSQKGLNDIYQCSIDVTGYGVPVICQSEKTLSIALHL